MRVLIVGCGYVGICLGANLVRQGHAVWGIRRSDSGDPALMAAGILPLKGDLTLPESFRALEARYDWVVNCVSASGGAALEYEQVYFRGTRHLISWLTEHPPSKFVYTSSTSVYGQTDGRWVDESSPAAPTALTARILVQTEELLLKAARENAFPAVVLRVAGIYGPGRTYWIDQMRTGLARIEGSGCRVLNMIHRDDVAGAILAALVRGEIGRVYNAVDDQPVSQMDLLRYLSRNLNRPMPAAVDLSDRPGKRGLTDKRVSNRRLKAELAYQFIFPSFREGYGALLKD